VCVPFLKFGVLYETIFSHMPGKQIIYGGGDTVGGGTKIFFLEGELGAFWVQEGLTWGMLCVNRGSPGVLNKLPLFLTDELYGKNFQKV